MNKGILSELIVNAHTHTQLLMLMHLYLRMLTHAQIDTHALVLIYICP